MAPRGRLLDLERYDVLFFYGDDGAYHQSDRVSVATYGIVFWPVFVVAALLLHLIVPFPHAAAVCGALYVAYCFLLDRAAQARGLPLPLRHALLTEPSRPTTRGKVEAMQVADGLRLP
jgi:hypothetical protein